MSESILIETTATLTGINQRIEYHGEDKHLAVDLSFTASLKAEVLDQLVPASNDLSKTFWRNNDEREAKYPQLGPFKCSTKFTEHRLTIALDKATDGDKLDVKNAKVKMAFELVTICKFLFEPSLAGVAHTDFKVQLEIKGPDLAKLSTQYFGENVAILVEPLNESLV